MSPVTPTNNPCVADPLTRKRRRGATVRGGFSLLEVILAMAILVGSLAVISQLIGLGAAGAVEARMRTDAILRCESKMQEIVAGVLPPEQVSPTPFEDDPAWQWSVEVNPEVSETLLAVTVTVEEAGSQSASPVVVRLERWMRDPLALEAIADTAASDNADASGSQ